MLPSPDAITAELCRKSFYDFFVTFWPTIETDELVPNWHIEQICAELQRVYETWARREAQPNVLINVPPGSSKSTIVSQLFPAWVWLQNAGTRILSSSHNAQLATQQAVQTRTCLRSPLFQRLYPGAVEFADDADNKTNYRTTAHGQRMVTSTSGSVIGNHFDFIIVDDPIDSQRLSDAGVDAARQHMKALSTRKTNAKRSVTILVMQRLHENDPAGEWLSSGKPIHHICLPAELTPTATVSPAHWAGYYVDGLLDPNRKDREALAQALVDLGSYGYAGQMMQRPAPDEGGILKKDWFTTISWQAFQALPGGANPTWQFDADTAYTEKQENDPSALVASVYLGQTLYVRFANEYRLQFPDLCKKLPELVKGHGYKTGSKVYVEPKATGISVVQQLRRDTQLNVVEAPSPKDSKKTRVNGVAPFVEAQRVVLLDGSWNTAFIEQCAGFPVAAHDDMLDCLVQAIERAIKGSGGSWSIVR